ncbi:pilus assembly protein [Streptomonospora sp. S1-112]|uniref:Pilus assembly protein n=1 Tax=Streptomonospora mangrovi TaxID=2883123 RepID=A0A9X3NJ81_9ACTN|nr:TadE family protein [Streptomonospora mangrovi]MDA0564859.1 pilus assembly protein [Streptomonospora mangrovi]
MSDRGSTELVLALPLAFTMIAAVLQLGLWAHAQQRADAVAHQAVSAARAYEATAADGHAAGAQALDQLGGALLTQPRLHVERATGRATARVEAVVPSLVPGWQPSVGAVRRGPVERLEAP